MIADRDFVTPISGEIHYAPCDRTRAEEFIVERGYNRAEWELRPWPTCLVCGNHGHDLTNRCWKCRGRTPCAIDGCTKSRKFEGYVSDERVWVCGIHWRQVCPPHSPLRRTYNRFFRIARRLGVENNQWPEDLERRYWRFFRGMVTRFDRGTAGFIDETAINKLFGWE